MPKKKKKTLEENLKKKIEEFSALYEVGQSITSTLHLNEVLKLITRKAAKSMNSTSCSLHLLDSKDEALVLKCSYGLANERFYRLKKRLRLGESVAGRVIKDGKAYIINDLRKKKNYKHLNITKPKLLRSLVIVPLVRKNKTIGVLSIYNKKVSKYTQGDIKLLSMFAAQAAICIENARLYKEAQTSYLNTIKTLSNIIDAKDSHTYGHSERVMEHCMDVAEELNFSIYDKEKLRYASLLHDIGKIGIDVGLLRKPSKLSNDEWKIMVMHPIMGSGIVEQIGFLSDLAPIILRHHERYDGKGYPGKFQKEKIPLGARILAVTDSYESMVSDRPYRKALSPSKARQELIKGAGTQFDPKIVKVFLKILDRRKKKKR